MASGLTMAHRAVRGNRNDNMNIKTLFIGAYILVLLGFSGALSFAQETPHKFRSAYEDDPILGKAFASGDIPALVKALHDKQIGSGAAELIFELPIDKQVPIWRDWLRDDKVWHNDRSLNHHYRSAQFKSQVLMQTTLSQFFGETIAFSDYLTDAQREALAKRIDEALANKSKTQH